MPNKYMTESIRPHDGFFKPGGTLDTITISKHYTKSCDLPELSYSEGHAGYFYFN